MSRIAARLMADPTGSSSTSEDSMPTGVEEAVLGTVAERLIPSGISWVKAWWSGKRMLILGPARSGKTSFINYLESDILFTERKSKITTRVTKRKSFVFALGEKRKVKIPIWKPRDVPGQVSPEKHVSYIERYEPDCIVVVLDATKFFLDPGREAESSLEWFKEFCQHLNSLLLRDPGLARSIDSMVVVMNKWDKIPSTNDKDDEANKEAFALYVREILDQYLSNMFYRKDGPNVIDVIPCALVESKCKKVLADYAVNSIASSLRE
jgi:GTPase SAR1 family protein